MKHTKSTILKYDKFLKLYVLRVCFVVEQLILPLTTSLIGISLTLRTVIRKADELMSKLSAIGNGLVGAGAVTLINEIARRSLDNASRLDVMGKNSLAMLFAPSINDRLGMHNYIKWP